MCDNFCRAAICIRGSLCLVCNRGQSWQLGMPWVRSEEAPHRNTEVTAHTCLAGCLVDRGTDTRSKAADLEGEMSAHLNLVDSVQWTILLLHYLDLQLYSVHILLDQPSSCSTGTAHAPASRGEKCVYLCLGFGKVVCIPNTTLIPLLIVLCIHSDCALGSIPGNLTHCDAGRGVLLYVCVSL